MDQESKDACERLALCIRGKPQWDRWIMVENPQTKKMEKVRQVSYAEVIAADILAAGAVAGESPIVKDLMLGSQCGNPDRPVVVKTRQVAHLLAEVAMRGQEPTPPAAPAAE